MQTNPRIKAYLELLQERLFLSNPVNIFDPLGMLTIDYNGNVVFQLGFDVGIAFLNVMAVLKPDPKNRTDDEEELGFYFKTMEYRRVSQSFDLIWLCDITAPLEEKDKKPEPIRMTPEEIVGFAICELSGAVTFAANVLCPDDEEIDDDPETPPWKEESDNLDHTPQFAGTGHASDENHLIIPGED